MKHCIMISTLMSLSTEILLVIKSLAANRVGTSRDITLGRVFGQ
jgi:hypothetical protein